VHRSFPARGVLHARRRGHQRRALRLGDTILLGADSEQSLAIGTSQKVCKIARGEGCFSAVIGPSPRATHN
jgi:hypothetical protein